MKNKSRILVLADDAGEVQRLQSVFTQLPEHWQVHFCKTQKEAMGFLEAQEYQLVFADLTGGVGAAAQFLHEVWKLHPKTCRYLLGDAVEVDVMVTCVLGAHQFLERPLEAAAVMAVVNRVEEINRLVGNKSIQTLVSRMRTFPSRPTLYLEVLKEFRSPSASPKVIGELVSKDLAVSTKLIQIVNSAYYGLAQHVTDPADAVLLIGMEATCSLILSIDAFAKFDKVKPLYFSVDRVWKHSQAVGHAARKFALSMTNDTAMANDAFTAGLLHDIGKLALALNFEEQYQGVLTVAEKNNIPAWKVEKEIFGASHAEIGAYLVSLWGLPIAIVEAVASHHLPASEVVGKFSAGTAVHLANACTDSDQTSTSTLSELTKQYPAELGLEKAMPQINESLSGSANQTSANTRIIKKTEVESASREEPGIAPEAEFIQVPQPARKRSSRGPLLCLAAAACVTLGGLGLYLWSNGTKDQADRTEARARKTEQAPAKPAAASTTATAAKEATQSVPPPAPEPEPLAGLKLQGIMFKGTESTMLINGAAFRVGDEVAGARIVSVTPREVTFQKGTAQHKLTLQ